MKSGTTKLLNMVFLQPAVTRVGLTTNDL